MSDKREIPTTSGENPTNNDQPPAATNLTENLEERIDDIPVDRDLYSSSDSETDDDEKGKGKMLVDPPEGYRKKNTKTAIQIAEENLLRKNPLKKLLLKEIKGSRKKDKEGNLIPGEGREPYNFLDVDKEVPIAFKDQEEEKSTKQINRELRKKLKNLIQTKALTEVNYETLSQQDSTMASDDDIKWITLLNEVKDGGFKEYREQKCFTAITNKILTGFYDPLKTKSLKPGSFMCSRSIPFTNRNYNILSGFVGSTFQVQNESYFDKDTHQVRKLTPAEFKDSKLHVGVGVIESVPRTQEFSIFGRDDLSFMESEFTDDITTVFTEICKREETNGHQTLGIQAKLAKKSEIIKRQRVCNVKVNFRGQIEDMPVQTVKVPVFRKGILMKIQEITITKDEKIFYYSLIKNMLQEVVSAMADYEKANGRTGERDRRAEKTTTTERVYGSVKGHCRGVKANQLTKNESRKGRLPTGASDLSQITNAKGSGGKSTSQGGKRKRIAHESVASAIEGINKIIAAYENRQQVPESKLAGAYGALREIRRYLPSDQTESVIENLAAHLRDRIKINQEEKEKYLSLIKTIEDATMTNDLILPLTPMDHLIMLHVDLKAYRSRAETWNNLINARQNTVMYSMMGDSLACGTQKEEGVKDLLSMFHEKPSTEMIHRLRGDRVADINGMFCNLNSGFGQIGERFSAEEGSLIISAPLIMGGQKIAYYPKPEIIMRKKMSLISNSIAPTFGTDKSKPKMDDWIITSIKKGKDIDQLLKEVNDKDFRYIVKWYDVKDNKEVKMPAYPNCNVNQTGTLAFVNFRGDDKVFYWKHKLDYDKVKQLQDLWVKGQIEDVKKHEYGFLFLSSPIPILPESQTEDDFFEMEPKDYPLTTQLDIFNNFDKQTDNKRKRENEEEKDPINLIEKDPNTISTFFHGNDLFTIYCDIIDSTVPSLEAIEQYYPNDPDKLSENAAINKLQRDAYAGVVLYARVHNIEHNLKHAEGISGEYTTEDGLHKTLERAKNLSRIRWEEAGVTIKDLTRRRFKLMSKEGIEKFYKVETAKEGEVEMKAEFFRLNDENLEAMDTSMLAPKINTKVARKRAVSKMFRSQKKGQTKEAHEAEQRRLKDYIRRSAMGEQLMDLNETIDERLEAVTREKAAKYQKTS